MKKIIDILKQDTTRIKILDIVAEMKLSQCYVAAGFLRNLIWDHTHNKSCTELNDIDVVYYDVEEQDHKNSENLQNKLIEKYPEYNWEVKNQALMHLRNNDPKNKSTLDVWYLLKDNI